MRVSLILLVYNQENYLCDAFRSIEAQSCSVDQLIITDDASTDKSKQLIRDFIAITRIADVLFIDNEANCGINACLNRAFSVVNGDVVCIQAGDDISAMDRVQMVCEAFDADADMGMMVTSYRLIDEKGEVVGHRRRQGVWSDIASMITRGSALPNFGLAFRRELIDFFMPMDTSINNEDDYIGFAGLVYFGRINVMPWLSYDYRMHSNSTSGWYTFEKDKTRLREKLYEQFENRRQNWGGWIRLLEKSNKFILEREWLIDLLKSKIELCRELEGLESKGFLYRLRLLVHYRRILSAKDILWVVMGVKSVSFVRIVRRIQWLKR